VRLTGFLNSGQRGVPRVLDSLSFAGLRIFQSDGKFSDDSGPLGCRGANNIAVILRAVACVAGQSF
jgi:hypothetical protein